MKKDGFKEQIWSTYIFDNFPRSPFFPLFFPPTEKSGQGGPPIIPQRFDFIFLITFFFYRDVFTSSIDSFELICFFFFNVEDNPEL